MRTLDTRLVAAVISAAAAFLPLTVAAQTAPPIGTVSSQPVADLQREIADVCGPVGLPVDSVTFGDFTGDGVQDIVTILDLRCETGFSYCVGDRGCSHRIWVGLGDGSYRFTNDILANEAAVSEWEGAPAIQFDGGPIWAWNGESFQLVSDPPAAAAPPPRDALTGQPETGPRRDALSGAVEDAPRRDALTGRFEDEPPASVLRGDRRSFETEAQALDDFGAEFDRQDAIVAQIDPAEENFVGVYSDEFDRLPPLRTRAPARGAPLPAEQIGAWAFQVADVGAGLARATVINAQGARFTLGCRTGLGFFVLRFFPSEFAQAGLNAGPGAQLLTELFVDDRFADDGLLVQRRFGGPYVARGIPIDGELVRRIRAGHNLDIQEAGTGQSVGRFALRGSARTIRRLEEVCRF